MREGDDKISPDQILDGKLSYHPVRCIVIVMFIFCLCMMSVGGYALFICTSCLWQHIVLYFSPMYGYHGDEVLFLKIYLYNPNMVGK